MDKYQFAELIQQTETFKAFPEFKKKITLSKENIEDLIDLHRQAEKYKISYLLQNPRLSSSSVKLINEILLLKNIN